MKCKILSFIIGLTVGEIVVSGTVTPAQAASFSQSTSTFSFFVYFENDFGPVENGTITSKVAKQECSQQTSTVKCVNSTSIVNDNIEYLAASNILHEVRVTSNNDGMFSQGIATSQIDIKYKANSNGNGLKLLLRWEPRYLIEARITPKGTAANASIHSNWSVIPKGDPPLLSTRNEVNTEFPGKPYVIADFRDSNFKPPLVLKNIELSQDKEGTLSLTVTNQASAESPKGIPEIPEFTSINTLLGLGSLGAASTLKRKLKPSQSTKKATTKVG